MIAPGQHRLAACAKELVYAVGQRAERRFAGGELGGDALAFGLGGREVVAAEQEVDPTEGEVDPSLNQRLTEALGPLGSQTDSPLHGGIVLGDRVAEDAIGLGRALLAPVVGLPHGTARLGELCQRHTELRGGQLTHALLVVFDPNHFLTEHALDAGSAGQKQRKVVCLSPRQGQFQHAGNELDAKGPVRTALGAQEEQVVDRLLRHRGALARRLGRFPVARQFVMLRVPRRLGGGGAVGGGGGRALGRALLGGEEGRAARGPPGTTLPRSAPSTKAVIVIARRLKAKREPTGTHAPLMGTDENVCSPGMSLVRQNECFSGGSHCLFQAVAHARRLKASGHRGQ